MSDSTAKNFYTTVDTEDGATTVHVNRRGCTGEWTDECQRALEALVRAVHRMDRDGTLPPSRFPQENDAEGGTR